MKTITSLAMVIILSVLATPVQASGITTELAKKIQKAGIGCSDWKVTKDKILYAGKRVTCTVNGERVNIESYTAKNFKKMVKYICDSGFPISAVSNSKTWIVSADSDETNQAIAASLKSKVVSLCP